MHKIENFEDLLEASENTTKVEKVKDSTPLDNTVTIDNSSFDCFELDLPFEEVEKIVENFMKNPYRGTNENALNL